MAKTLFELAQEYLNQGMPDITQTPRVVTPPATTMPVPIPPGGSPTARILPMPQGGGGGGFGVYNADPNSTRTQSNYSPYAYRQAFGKTDYQDFNPSSTYAAKQMEMNPEYYEGKQLTGIPGAAANYLNNSFLGKGLSALGDKLPVNRRAILENELLGAGMQLNDIGQFVSDGGDINKADGSNIMAGYNAAKVTQETFDKRRATINAKMKDPKQKAAKLAALDAAEESFFGAKTKADMVFDDKSLTKNPDYVSQKIIDQKMKEAVEGEDDSDDDIDSFDPLNQIDFMPSFAGMNAPSTFTLTAPQYGDSFGQGYGSGYGNNSIITGGTNQNDFDGLGPITGGTNQNDFVGLGPITGGTNQNDYSGGGYNAGSGYNTTGQGGPAGQGSITNPSNYGTGSGNLGDYQMQPSTPVSYTHLTLPTNREV